MTKNDIAVLHGSLYAIEDMMTSLICALETDGQLDGKQLTAQIGQRAQLLPQHAASDWMREWMPHAQTVMRRVSQQVTEARINRR